MPKMNIYLIWSNGMLVLERKQEPIANIFMYLFDQHLYETNITSLTINSMFKLEWQDNTIILCFFSSHLIFLAMSLSLHHAKLNCSWADEIAVVDVLQTKDTGDVGCLEDNNWVVIRDRHFCLFVSNHVTVFIQWRYFAVSQNNNYIYILSRFHIVIHQCLHGNKKKEPLCVRCILCIYYLMHCCYRYWLF